MKSLASPSFWKCLSSLPEEIQQLAAKNYRLWIENPRHPSIHFKSIEGDLWSARVGMHYRAVGRFQDAETFLWIWIGSHEEYNRL